MITFPSLHQSLSQLAEKTRFKVVCLGGIGSPLLSLLNLEALAVAAPTFIHTDSQQINRSIARERILLGTGITGGIGSGGDPETGRQAAEESFPELIKAFEDFDIVIIVACLGGGTGSGALPVVARAVKEAGGTPLAIVTLPFHFEAAVRKQRAWSSLDSSREHCDLILCFENDRMRELAPPAASITEPFDATNRLLADTITAAIRIFQRRGLLGIGRDELLQILRQQDARCMFGHGRSSGSNRALDALNLALKGPLFDRSHLQHDASSVIAHLSAGNSLTLSEVQVSMEELGRFIRPETSLHIGISVDPSLGESLDITLLSSYDAMKPSRALPQASAPSDNEDHLGLLASANALQSTTRLAPKTASTKKSSSSKDSKPQAQQDMLPLDGSRKGRFEKSEPFIIDGEDLDIPTFLRRNIRLPR